ncbi:MAG: RNA-guided endonuclease InsQ/TnpB family protein [Gammaproteobacteria bacterium]
MIQRQLKLKLTKTQATSCDAWLFQCTGIYNWVIRKIELDAQGGVYWTYYGLLYQIAGHSAKCGIPARMIHGTIKRAHQAWDRCFKKLGKRPHLKSARNRLNGLDIAGDVRRHGDRISVPGLGRVRYHKDTLPDGKIKACRLIKKASGWHLCVCIEAEPNSIPRRAFGEIGIDPGFSALLTTTLGEVIEHPRELEASAARLAAAQRGGHKKQAARIHEHIANQRRDRNHKLSRRLVRENIIIYFSDDSHRAVARSFGKSVASSGHAQLQQMLGYKSRIGGTRYVEVASPYSTMTCSACWARNGPTGYAGLIVRHWTCVACGAHHDRDVNAAEVTKVVGARSALVAATGFPVVSEIVPRYASGSWTEQLRAA